MAAAVVATVGLLPIPAVAAPNGTETVTVGTRLVDVTFNDPNNSVQWSKAAKLINDAPRGSTIRMAVYNISDNEVSTAIKNAHDRGVYVYIVANGEHHTGESAEQGATERDLERKLGSRFKWCDGPTGTGNDACISNHTGLMHAKYMLFSQTKGSAGATRKNVVWVSSANFSGSGIDKYNNSVTVYDDPELYNGFISDVWSPMWNGDSTSYSDYYDSPSGRGYFLSAASNSTVYVSPEADTDQWVERLNFVKADPDCRIRVMHNVFRDTRVAVANKLNALAGGGCVIQVLTQTMEPAVASALNRTGITVRTERLVHDKSILIDARYGDEQSPPRRYIVFTGSHNLTKPALRYNDELILKLADSKPLHDLYVAHFNRAWASPAFPTNPGSDPDSRAAAELPESPPPPPPPPPASPCQDNDYWRAQFGVSAWEYIPNSDQTQTNQKRYIFDRVWYYSMYADVRTWAQNKVATQGGSVWDHVQWHWLNYGIPQGRVGAPTFDAEYYLSNYADLRNAFGTNYQAAIDHYVVYGRNEGRRGSSLFDPGFYRSCYGDLAAMSNAELLEHFIRLGIEEGRQGSSTFAPAWYLAAYPDVRAAFGNNNYRGAMIHWLVNGRNEGRSGHS